MKLDEVKNIARFGFSKTEADQRLIHEYLRTQGIDPANLYQELEMSSPYVNTHRDTTYSNITVNLHSHSYCEVLYCRSGVGVEYLVGSDRYRLQPGDIVFIAPGISHRPILPERLEEPYIRDVLWINEEFIEQLHRAFPDPHRGTYDMSGPIRTAGTRWEFLGELFRYGVEEEERKRPGWETAIIGNTLSILANLKRAVMEQSTDPMEAEKPELLDRITGYVEQNYQYHITVGDLARRFYVSESTISHLFKQKMGVSLYRYVTQRRLIAAKILISQKMALDEVARLVGFSDYSSFYRAFKQEYGISPRQYGKL